MPNDPELADCVIGTSEFITGLHKSGDDLITDHLSALVVGATGSLIFHEMGAPRGPVAWLNHDVVAKQLNASRP